MQHDVGRCLMGIWMLLLLAGCTTGSQVHPTTLHKNLSLHPGSLQQLIQNLP